MILFLFLTIGRTTLVIAHRLSTIRNVDKIIVIEKGEVVEEGDHDTLMRAKGAYFGLIKQQNVRQTETEEDNDEEEEEELEFEHQETTKRLLSHQTSLDYSDVKSDHYSTVGSLSPLISTALYRMKSSREDEDMEEDKSKTIKVMKKLEK
jgi:ABC-type multidrug transport system ATPase subunit